MKLSDIVSSLHLSIFAEVPLLLFMGVFLGVVIHVLSNKERLESAGSLPLQERSQQNSEGST